MEHETVLGLLDKRYRAQVHFTPVVAFDERDLMMLPATLGLIELAKLATSIIAMFDSA